MSGSSSAERVIVYIDGFNLYHGLRARHRRKYIWLDLGRVANQLLRPNQVLVAVRYFTAPVRNDPPAQARQRNYLAALRAATSIEIILGRFQVKQRECRQCHASWVTYEEKETDVSLAVSMVEDAATDRFDTALLISADSDLCPAADAVHRLPGDKRIVAVFPPKRHSDDLRRHVDATMTLGEGILRRCLLPPVVKGPPGKTYRRPSTWR